MNVRELFGNISGTYDLLNRVMSFGIDQRWRKKGIALLPHGPKSRVLDIASGTLDMALHYLHEGEGEVFALDFCEPMLLTGRLKVSPLVDDRLNIVCGDSLDIPFPDNYFSAAMCAWGVRNFKNVQRNTEEVWRVLQPGGVFLVIDFFKPTNTFSKAFSKTYGKYIMPALGKWIAKDNAAYEYLHQSIEAFYTLNEYTWMMTQSRFTVLQRQELTRGISSLVLAQKNEE